jgi:hypothetical protein
MAVACLLLASAAARATTVWIPPVVHDCAFAPDDTVRIEVMLNGIDDPIDDAGLKVGYDPSRLTFIRAERGALIAAWATFNVTPQAIEVDIDAAGAVPVPNHISGQFAKLVFIATCCNSANTEVIPICPASTGDLANAVVLCGTATCVVGTPGGLTLGSIFHTCGSADGDTVEVAVRIEDSAEDIDAAGVDIMYNVFDLEYVGFKRGALTAAWPFFGVAEVLGGLRVGGFTSTAIPSGTSGVFAVLRFVVSCCGGPGSVTPLCAQSLVDDFATMDAGCGVVTCTPLATQASSWGYVKSLYR